MADGEEKERSGATQTAPPSAPPPIITQTSRRGGRQWPMLLAYMLVALIVAAGVVFGGRWVYNQVRNEPAEETTITSDRAPEPPATSSSQSGAPTQKPSNQPPPTPTPSPAIRGDRIANTGPGEVVALFITATIAAAGLHYLISLRRANQ